MEDKVLVPITWEFGGPNKAEPGDLVTFELFAKDLQDKPIEVKPVQLNVILWINDKYRGMCEETGKRRKTGIGAYAFDFSPRILGIHHFKIFNGHIQLFKDKEIPINITSEVLDVTLDYDFEIEGKGLLSVRLREEVKLSINVKENGKPVDPDKDKFSVEVFGNGRTTMAKLCRLGAGRYEASFTAHSPGVYSAAIIFEGTKVKKQRIDFYEYANARCSRIDSRPVSVTAGQPSKFVIQSIDMHGNVTGVGGDLWEVLITDGPKLENPVPVPLKIVDHLNGKYTVEFTLPSPGQYKFNVLLSGETLKNCPFKLKAE